LNRTSKVIDLIVIGAGISGIFVARSIPQHRVLILEKSRAPGGRIATRRTRYEDPTAPCFDYGAQFITARHLIFQELCSAWEQKGVLDQWVPSFFSEEHPSPQSKSIRYHSNQGLRSLTGFLAAGLSIELETEVLHIHKEDKVWNLQTNRGQIYQSRLLCLSCPIPQSLNLLRDVEIDESLLRSLQKVEYEKCISITVASDMKSKLPQEGGIWPKLSTGFQWIADQQTKGLSDKPLLVFHLTAERSEELFEVEAHQIYESMMDSIREYFPKEASLEFVHLHKWRYSKPKTTVNTNFIKAHSEPGLYLCGEYFAGARVEGAVLSGMATGQAIREELLNATSTDKLTSNDVDQ